MAQVFGIAFAQFLGCTLWFSVNGVSSALIEHWGLEASDIGLLTGAVQAGFITGTLGLAISNIADRFRPSLIFFWASLIGAMANLLFAYQANGLSEGLVYRFIVGICLAGIYPIGMKLIVSWSPKLPGVGLGLVVGMLTLGTASPHLFNGLFIRVGDVSWRVQADGLRRLFELLHRAAVEVGIGREALVGSANDRQHQRKAIAGRANHGFGASPNPHPGADVARV